MHLPKLLDIARNEVDRVTVTKISHQVPANLFPIKETLLFAVTVARTIPIQAFLDKGVDLRIFGVRGIDLYLTIHVVPLNPL